MALDDRAMVRWRWAGMALVMGCGPAVEPSMGSQGGSGGTTGEPGELAVCPGLVWAANASADLLLVDVEAGAFEVVAELPVGTWAFATDPTTGWLRLVENVNEAPRHFVVDPNTGAFEQLQVEVTSKFVRAGYDPEGTLWMMSADAADVFSFGTDGAATLLGPTGIGDGGDLVYFEGRVLVTWWPNRVGELVLADGVAGVDELAPLVAEGSPSFSGITSDGVALWVSTIDGDLYRLDMDSELSLEFRVATGSEVNDLAPVIAPQGACPSV